MANCPNCNHPVKPGARFCAQCGTKIEGESTALQPTVQTTPADTNMQELNTAFELKATPKYEGKERTFPFLGDTLVISSAMDAYITYRKIFRYNARQMQTCLVRDYQSRVTSLDRFFTDFPVMYANYRKPLLEAAFRLLLDYDIYDISAETFEQYHDGDFHSCNNTYETMIEAFNNTIVENQNRRARRFNMMPGLIFSGVGGIVAAAAFNVATTKAMEASIRNADVSPAQRNELFQRINTGILMDNVFEDYWAVHYSVTFQLNKHGCDVWYPTVENNAKASGLLENVRAGLVPADKKVGALMQVIHARPQQDGLFRYLNECYPNNPDIMTLNSYFGYYNGII